MKLSMFTQQMVSAEFLGRDVPYPHKNKSFRYMKVMQGV